MSTWFQDYSRSAAMSCRQAGARCAAAIDRAITAERLWLYPLAVLVVGAVVMAGAILLGDYPQVAGGGVVLPDYLAHWTGGRMLLDGETSHLYDPAAQRMVQDHAVTPDALSWFISPPFVTLLYAPLALLSYGASAGVWTLITLGCVVASVWLMRPFAPSLFTHHFAGVVLIFAATQPMFELFGSGQDSGLSLLLWVAGIRLMLARRDVPAGIVFALGLFKPQQFLLVPIVLLVQRRYRALAAWAATAAVLGATSVAVVGVGGVIDWLRLPAGGYYDNAVHVAQAWKMQSLPALVTTVFPASWSPVTSVCSLVVTLVAIIVLIRQLLRAPGAGVPELAVWMLAMLATVVVSPHLFIYDLVLAFVPILYLVENHTSRTIRVSCVALFVLTWTVPLRHVIAMDHPWPVSLIDASWAAVPLLVLWVSFARASGLARTPGRLSG